MQGRNVFIIFTLVLLLSVLFFNQGEQNVPPPTVSKDGNKKVELQAGLNDPRDPQQNTPDPYTPKPVRISTTEEKSAGAQEHWRGLKGNALRSNIYTLEKPISSKEVLNVGQLLTLNLFDDVIIDAEVTSSTKNINGTIGTTAHIRGSQWGRVFIAQTSGEVRAKILDPENNKIYGIHFNPANRQHYALELDISTEQVDDDGPHPRVSELTGSSTYKQPLRESFIPLEDESVSDAVVDIMVVYSTGAFTASGSNVNNMHNVIAIGILMGNDSHANTGTGITLNLVHSAQVVYADSGSNLADLVRLQDPADTYMDTIHATRDQYGADFVSLINDQGGGIAYVIDTPSGDATFAFSVVGFSDFDSYVPVHELGHNMGLSHAADQNTQPGPTGPPIGNDAAGWHWHTDYTPGVKGFCSVMTYTSGIYFADGLSHIRVGLFSDPNITHNYSGLAAGDITLANNARVLRWLKGVYEGYRDRTISSPPILVYYPNGSEQLKEGNTYYIMWDSDSISGNVKIDLYENNVFRQTIAADTLNDRTYEWTVPANLSGSTFHIRISSVSDGTKFDESDGFFTITETIFNDPLNTNSGFTTTSTGADGWEFGAWSVETEKYEGPDEPYTGPNLFDTDLSGATFNTTTLTTSALDCSNFQQVRLEFAGWFSIGSGFRARVQVSINNSTWHDLYSQEGDFTSSAWKVYDFDISSYADGESTVYIRWVHEDLGGNSNYAGMSVDDIKVTGISAPPSDILAPVFTFVPADIIAKTADPNQTSTIVSWLDPIAIDNVDGTVTPIQTSLPLKGSAFPLGVHTVTYQATDSSGNSSTASFTVTVIPGTKFPWVMFLPAIISPPLP